MTQESMLAILKQLPEEFRVTLSRCIQESIDAEDFSELNDVLGGQISMEEMIREYRCCY